MKKEAKEVELLDTDREVTMDEVRECCEANEWDVPAEDSDRYWEIVNDLRQWDVDDFKGDACYHFDLGLCLVKGYCGLWYGNCAAGKLMTVDSGRDLFFQDVDRVRIAIDSDDGLVVKNYHHDGTNRFVVYKVTPRGQKFIDNHDGEFSDRELHERLIAAHLVKKIRLKDILD